MKIINSAMQFQIGVQNFKGSPTGCGGTYEVRTTTTFK